MNATWKEICKSRKIGRALEIMYSTTASRISTFKGLVKTHKGTDVLKIRPVVNTIGSPTYMATTENLATIPSQVTLLKKQQR